MDSVFTYQLRVGGKITSNTSAVEFLKKNPEKRMMDYWTENRRESVNNEKELNKIDWCAMSRNTNAIHLLEMHPDKIDWCALSSNPSAIHIL